MRDARRLIVLCLILCSPSEAQSQLSPGTYILSAPLAAATQHQDVTLVHLGRPIDLAAFGPDVSAVSEGLAQNPSPTACMTFVERSGRDSESHIALIFLTPKEQPTGDTGIEPPGSPDLLLLLRADEAGFSGKVLGAPEPDEQNLVLGTRIGPPNIAACIAVARELSAG